MAVKVLIVDDVEMKRRAEKRVLEEESDIEVVAEANDDLTAFLSAEQFTADVIVMDVAMPFIDGFGGHRQSYYHQILKSAVRSHDPLHRIVGVWLMRRLSPIPILSRSTTCQRSATRKACSMPWTQRLLTCMSEANARLGILKDLRRRKSDWLRSAARDMAKAIERFPGILFAAKSGDEAVLGFAANLPATFFEQTA